MKWMEFYLLNEYIKGIHLHNMQTSYDIQVQNEK